MAVSGWSVSDYLASTGPLALAEPYMRSFWVYVPGTAAGAGAGGVHTYDGNDGNDDEARFGFLNPDNGNFNVCSRASSTNSCATFNPVPEDQWVHASCEYVSSVLRGIRVNAGVVVTNTDSRAPAAPVVSLIGTDFAPSAAPLNAAIGVASISYWDESGFSAGDRAALDAELNSGRSPIAISADVAEAWSGRLITIEGERSYAELVDTSDLGPYAIVGSLDVFLVGGNPSHPPVDPASADMSPLLDLARAAIAAGADPAAVAARWESLYTGAYWPPAAHPPRAYPPKAWPPASWFGADQAVDDTAFTDLIP